MDSPNALGLHRVRDQEQERHQRAGSRGPHRDLHAVPGGPFDLLRASNPRITQSQIDRLNALLANPLIEDYEVVPAE